MAKEKKTETKGACFVIMEIGAEGSAERARSDEVFFDIIEPAVKEAGYGPVDRADHIAEPGKITAQIIEKLITVPLVVVDLTGLNANVIYELGVRHSTGKPVVQIMEQVDKLPFDLYDVRTIQFARNIRKAKQAISDITTHLRSLEDKPYEPPFTAVLQMISLRESGKPESAILADIMKEIQIIQSDISPLASYVREMRNRSIHSPARRRTVTDFIEALDERAKQILPTSTTVTPPPDTYESPPPDYDPRG